MDTAYGRATRLLVPVMACIQIMDLLTGLPVCVSVVAALINSPARPVLFITLVWSVVGILEALVAVRWILRFCTSSHGMFLQVAGFG